MNNKLKSAELMFVRKRFEEVTPHPKNPRVHDEKQIAKLRHLIKKHGYAKGSIVYQKSTGYLLAGHGIMEALKLEGYNGADMVELDIPDGQAEAFMIADNKVGEQSTWDNVGLQSLINELSEMDIPALDYGFDSSDLEALASQILAGSGGYQAEPQDDDIPETVEPITKTGDLWTLGKHRVLCGDSTKAEDVERLMGGNLADLVFTDPPYGVDYGKKNRFLNSFQPSGRNLRDIANDTIGKDELLTMLVNAFTLIVKYSHDHCSYYVTAPQGGELGLMMMMMMMMMSGIPTRHVLIWVKNSPNFSLGRLDYEYQHEPILFAWKKTHNKYQKGDHKTSVWNIDKPRKSDLHPTMKPIELISNAILNSSKEDDLVVDIFLGSGSTLIACQKLNRVCYGIEIDCHYCDVIVKRYIDFVGSADGVFVERDGQKLSYKEVSNG